MQKTYFFLLLLAIVLIVSCVPQRKIVYVQSRDRLIDYEYQVVKRDVRIEPFDVLYINVGSIDQPEYNFFNLEKQNFSSISESTLSVLGYTVNDSGCVSLPVIGKVKVRGLTLDEAAEAVKNSTKGLLNNAIVSVRFVNNTITILGEVEKPGTYAYTNEELTIFRGIGLAGDIGEYGNRRNVMLIRERDKKVHKYSLDLTRDDIFKSDYYYLRPKDVIYVEPLKIRRFGMKEYPFALLVSVLSSVFIIFAYVKK